MKIALYIEDGREQIVLTPATETERAILNKLHDGSRSFSLKKGSFYDCQGGWTRHAHQSFTDGVMFPSESKDDVSTMIVMDPPLSAEERWKAGLAGIPEDCLTAAGRHAAGLPPLPAFAVEDDNDARYAAFAAGYAAALGKDDEVGLSENSASSLSVAWANWRHR